MSLFCNSKFYRALLSFIFLLLICNYGIAQEYQYFNNRYDISGFINQDECYKIIESNNGYILAVSSNVLDSIVSRWEMNLTKIDNFGSVQFNQTIGDVSVDYRFPYIPRCLVKENSVYFAVGQMSTPSNSGFLDQGIIICLDEDLDTIWSRRFGEKNVPYDTSFIFTSLQCIDQNHLIVSGGWKPYGLKSHVYLLKTDTSGNQIWSRSFEYYDNYIEGYCVVQTIDYGFAVGCFKQIPGYPTSVDPVIIKTDSLGIEQWTKNVGGPYKDFIPMISIAQDGNIIIGTSYGDTMDTPDIPLSRINILKLDNDGNILWNKKYGLSQPNNFLRNINVQNDGSIIAVGAVFKYNPNPDRIGWIFKTDANGDSLWYREYYNLSGQDSRNYLYDVISTSDNGLIACGYVDPYPTDTGSTDTWVIKLDSIGCEFAGCDTTVGVREQGGMEAWGQGEVEVWPNPASQVISVKSSVLISGRDYSLVVYDIFGRPAPIPDPSPTRGKGEVWWSLDVSGLPPGVYFISIVEDGRRVRGGKFVVCR